jgi:hypothetical protein
MAAYYQGVPIRNTAPLNQNQSIMRGMIVFVALLSLSPNATAKKKPPTLKCAQCIPIRSGIQATAGMSPKADCCSPPILSRANGRDQGRGFFPGPAKHAPPVSSAVFAQSGTATENKAHSAPASAPSSVSLSPRFVPGQTFRYNMEFETTTATSRSGMAADPQGPSKLVIDWDATILLEVLPTEAGAPGNIRLRTKYEKSTAHVTSDTFDPAAVATEDQYRNLEGKVVEFSLDANGKMISVSGLGEIVDGEKAVQSAREWIAQLNAASGAPAGGVTVGQKWSSDQPATSLPVAGMVWRTESEYLRDENCHPPNPEAPPAPSNTESPVNPEPAETCAVILTRLNLVRPKSVRDSTPEEYRKRGVQTAGKWDGSAESLSYISLRTGLAVSVTQTGTEEMDVTLATAKNTSMHYAGTILSRSQVALVADHPDEK